MVAKFSVCVAETSLREDTSSTAQICLVQVGTNIELDTVGRQFEPTGASGALVV